MRFKHFCSLLICFLLIWTATACGSSKQASEPCCPFTTLGWDSTINNVISVEGNDFSTYDSVYGGTCYTFPKEYEGRQGTVKYMFDGEDRLMCVAWTYGCDDADELLTLYETIDAYTNSSFGESNYNADHPGNYGNVWYREKGDIILSTMITTETKALQYAFLHPLVSNQEAQSSSSN